MRVVWGRTAEWRGKVGQDFMATESSALQTIVFLTFQSIKETSHQRFARKETRKIKCKPIEEQNPQ